MIMGSTNKGTKMKGKILASITLCCSWLLTYQPVHALSLETEVLLELLQNKGVITEQDAESFRSAIKERLAAEEEKKPEEDEAYHYHSVQSLGKRLEKLEKKPEERLAAEEGKKPEEDEAYHYHSVQSLEQRLEKLEKKPAEEPAGTWADNIELSGILAVEASSEKFESGTPGVATEKSSSIVLSTAELDIDAYISDHVDGHLTILYEEDEQDQVVIDEGILAIDGEDKWPFYAHIGKMYVPFGWYESHFVTDPLTLDLGETNQTAIVAGYINDLLDLSVGAFNGDIDKTGNNDHANNFVASALFTMPEDTIPDLDMIIGASYITNLADSDGLTGTDEEGDQYVADTVKNYVGGFSIFVNTSFKDKVTFYAEYLGATESFQAGELLFDGGNAYRPRAWNLELAYAFLPALEFAIRYAGSDDGGSAEVNFMAEEQYGAAVLYNLPLDTYLTIEYLHSEYKSNDETSGVTVNMAVEF